MNKSFLIFCICILLMVMGSGLGWSGGGPEGKALVRFQTVETDPESLKIYADAKARFESNHPMVKIQVEPLPTMDDEEKAFLAMAAGIQPGCATVDTSLLPLYADLGYLQPIDDLVKETGDKFIPNAISKHADGKYYWLPYAADTPFVWGRKDLMDAKGLSIPETWDEWLHVAQALTEDNMYGMSFPLGRTSAGEYFLVPLIWSAGSTLFDKDLNVTIDTEATRKAFRFIKEMYKYSPPGCTEYSYEEQINVFVSEQCALSPYAGRTLSRMIAHNPSLIEKATVFPYPKDKIKTTFIDWNSYAVFKKTGVERQSEEFIKFLLTDDKFVIDFLLSVPGHLIPPQKGMLTNPKFIGADVIKNNKEKIQVLFGSPEYAIQYFFESGAIQGGKIVPGNRGTFNPVVASLWSESLTGKYIQQYIIEGKDLDEVVKAYQAEVEDLATKIFKKKS
jgi:multiple sugar transport system substrate-binding protein